MSRRYLDDHEEASIERLIDEHGLEAVLASIADICWQKEEHVESNWQDSGLARLWHKAGKAVDACAHKSQVKGLP